MLLEIKQLVKIYGQRRVVDGVSFNIAEGEIVGLLGRNGAGKTTTFRMVTGLISPSSGEITFLTNQKGEKGMVEVTGLPMYKRALYGMGYLPQESSVFQNLSVEDNLLAILETRPISRGRRLSEAKKLLNEFGLSNLANQKATTLSGGETRRLEIARALITEPTLLLLDEPFSGVDPISVSEIQDIIKRLKSKGISILLTDHNVRETLAVTDRSYIIDAGQILCSGTPSEIMNNPLARQKYLGRDFYI
ncbi:MAG: LPS export ABC transporter ATP-binding protein [Planctomycetota bacterium]